MAGRLARAGLVFASVLFSLLVLELACRLVRGGPGALVHWPNLAWEMMRENDDGGGCTYLHDDLLGWSSPHGCTSAGYNTDRDGFRRQPAIADAGGPPVLVTGSSFAMGSETGDGETWPAYLQEKLGRRVVNAGVSGYSIDQSVLESERLARELKPVLIIMSFTPGDVWRNELSMAYSRQKPWFEPSEGGLELRNVPVAKPARAPPLPPASRWFGWSMLAAEIVERFGIRDGWYYREKRALPANEGDKVACRLMPRLATLGIPVVVLAQYGLGHWQGDADYRARGSKAVAGVLRCAADAGLIAVDLAPPLQEAAAARGLPALYRSEHHSSDGNRFIADLLAAEIARRQFLTRSSSL